LKNQAALLELALVNWAINYVTKKGYTFIITPDLCKKQIIDGCGFSPRSQEACK
jgi:seryl-tRNA synthetase